MDSPGAGGTHLDLVSVMFNFTVVNIYFKGLHAYSGLS
jgi:hypothetical protein